MRVLVPILLLLSVLFFVSSSATTTVQIVASVVGTNNVPPGTACNAESGTYTSNPTDHWGPVAVNATARTFICIHNLGSGSYSVQITVILPRHDGTINTPQSGATVAAGAYALIEFDWKVSPGAKIGQASFLVMFRSS